MVEKYLFVDGHNLLHRSFHALKEMRRMDGKRNGAICGFLKSLASVRWDADIQLRNTVVFWDDGHSQQRLDIYPDYKAHRREADEQKQRERESLRRQQQVLESLLVYTGLRQVRVAGVEADDLIGVFSSRVRTSDSSVLVYSGDQDMHQLISPGIKILDPSKGLVSSSVLEKTWGTSNVRRLAQLKSIQGDPSDNIKGVPRVGKKRAAQVVPYFLIPEHEGAGPLTQDTKKEVDKKDQKWVDKVLEYSEVVVRNYSLVKLPKTWAESFLTLYQIEQALVQFSEVPPKDRKAFSKALIEQELLDEVHSLHRW